MKTHSINACPVLLKEFYCHWWIFTGLSFFFPTNWVLRIWLQKVPRFSFNRHGCRYQDSKKASYHCISVEIEGTMYVVSMSRFKCKRLCVNDRGIKANYVTEKCLLAMKEKMGDIRESPFCGSWIYRICTPLWFGLWVKWQIRWTSK